MTNPGASPTSATPEPGDRDGTSQHQRRSPALDPGHALVDERSVQDLLREARAFGSTLTYFGADGVAAGDWSGFVPADLDLDEVAAFLEHPEGFSPETSPALFRPHFVLFLTFLRLLRRAQREINTFGRRHLDFYYRELLRLAPKPARPDHVNLLVDLAAGAEQALVASGTRFAAGTDPSGHERHYATDRDVVMSRAQLERVSSVHVRKRLTGLEEVRDRNPGPRSETLLAMLRLALGRPDPGDPLPPYPAGNRQLDATLLDEVKDLLDFVETGLHLTFGELRTLMRLRNQRATGDDDAWRRIHEILRSVRRSRSDEEIDSTGRDLTASVHRAIGRTPPYDTVTEIDDLYDLFRLRTTAAGTAFIAEHLAPLSFDQFVALMQAKVTMDTEWAAINDLLEDAGRRRTGNAEFVLTGADPTAFAVNLTEALGTLVYPALAGDSLSGYHAAVEQAADYFNMSPEDLTHVLSMRGDPPRDAPWSTVDAMLVEAHRALISTVRSDRLRQRRKAQPDGGRLAVLQAVLGTDSAKVDIEQLRPYLTPENHTRLEALIGTAGEPSDASWAEAYPLLEIAQRNREGRGEPIPCAEEWLSLEAAPDARVVSANRLDAGTGPTRWHTFGRSVAPDTGGAALEPAIGWACSSPLLALSEGARTIAMTLSFDGEGFDAAQLRAGFAGGPICAQISTDDGWVEPDDLDVEIAAPAPAAAATGTIGSTGRDDHTLTFTLTFSDLVAAFTPATAASAGFDTAAPVLRLMLRQAPLTRASGHPTPYALFRSLRLERVHLEVSVVGLQPSHLENDESVLDPATPFEPFGTSPATGSRLRIGHPELAVQRLRTLTYGIEWMGTPPVLATHYAGYGLTPAGTVTLGLVEQGITSTLGTSVGLFGSAPLKAEGLAVRRRSATAIAGDLRQWDRYLTWELTGEDFQHRNYPALAARKAVDLAAAIANRKPGDTITAADYQLNPPYTPKIKRLLVDYTAGMTVDLAAAEENDPADQILHVHPFGVGDIETARTIEGLPFVPSYEDEGELYVGLRGVQPGQTLSLLFQMADGSADSDLEPAAVRWSYLRHDRWLPLTGAAMPLDTTRGLRNTGIIEFALDEAGPNRLLAPDLYWLRASVARDTASLCDTIAIHTQAVSATLVDGDHDPRHFASPLPADSVEGPVVPNPLIGAVRQPYTSIGGHAAEPSGAFDARVSERLRHKDRALTVWDYERLVLEQFPDIYKVKCIPAGSGTPSANTGVVTVVVIPDARDRLPFDPFQPKTPTDLLTDIEAFLDARTPPTAAVRVVNPHYVPVRVRLAARFSTQGNDEYFKARLIDDLNRFLSPWAYDESSEIVVGGKIYANSILDFLDRLPYVDYIADLRLFTNRDGKTFTLVPTVAEGYHVAIDRPDDVLVADPDHVIDTVSDTHYDQKLLTGIGFMKIGLDFAIPVVATTA